MTPEELAAAISSVTKNTVIELPQSAGFRPGTTGNPYRMHFCFVNGGMGDFICWMQAIRYLTHTAPWIHGTLVTPTYFKTLAQHWITLTKNRHWRVMDIEQFKKVGSNELVKGPFDPKSALSGICADLVTCGFAHFTNVCPAPPEWNHHPPLSDITKYLPKVIKGLNQPYVVLTPDGVDDNRSAPSKMWLPLIAHIIKRGFTPVYLGKSENKEIRVKTRYDGGLDDAPGINLRDKTSLLEAAAVIDGAYAMIGLDGGLCHLSACTNTNLIMGLTNVPPVIRTPRKSPTLRGTVSLLYLTREELACTGCLLNLNLYASELKNCFYGDNACISMLFENECERWIKAFDSLPTPS